MKDSFLDIEFPKTLKVSSDSEMIPFHFFGLVIPNSKKIQFKLGYFSTTSISTLSYGFAQFIINGGEIDFLINNFVSDDDYNLLNNSIEFDNQVTSKFVEKILNDLEELNDVLSKKQSQHFFNCLRFLIDNKRLNFFPVTTKNGEISHYKEALFWDNNDNVINIVGSCNFTYKGIVCNGESFIINRSWGSDSEVANISNEIEKYSTIFNKKSNEFIYLTNKDLINVIYDKTVPLSEKELLEEEIDLISLEKNENIDSLKINKIANVLKYKFDQTLEKISNTPKFPFGNKPRDYQVRAYENWVLNNYSGIFGMATGTGKTKTSLNCILNEYNKQNEYYVLILVPSIALLEQWEQEVIDFNFKNILTVGGGSNWEKKLSNYVSNLRAGVKRNIVIISTYASFCIPRFQLSFSKIDSYFTLIADEAHNMGANNIKKVFSESKISKRIGLSATPKRIYDLEGSKFLNTFFKDEEPYTFSFTMKEAMESGFLTNYKYYPKIVELSETELEKYTEISKKLLKFFDFEKGEFKKDPIVEKLLLLRKNIIHKAENKIKCFVDILNELKNLNKLKYIFAYIPEGYIYKDENNPEKLIDKFLNAGFEAIPTLKMNSYTSESDDLKDLLKGFSDGRIDLLFAMKMLDEGVDVPRAEIGIFASSTGNPRQFIQRRGRLLRLHNDKIIAQIYDMVVVPRINDSNLELFNMERNLVKNELKRVGYFSSLSLNFYDSRDSLINVCNKYELDLDTIINELE